VKSRLLCTAGRHCGSGGGRNGSGGGRSNRGSRLGLLFNCRGRACESRGSILGRLGRLLGRRRNIPGGARNTRLFWQDTTHTPVPQKPAFGLIHVFLFIFNARCTKIRSCFAKLCARHSPVPIDRVWRRAIFTRIETPKSNACGTSSCTTSCLLIFGHRSSRGPVKNLMVGGSGVVTVQGFTLEQDDKNDL